MNKNNRLSIEFEKITGQKFETFYNKHKPKLVWYLTRYTKDQESAEDFADDAFTQALLKINNYNSEKSQVHTWIYKIAENLVKKDFKDKKRMAVVSLDKDNSDTNLNLINIIPNTDTNDDYNIEQDKVILKKAEIVKDIILKLPDKYKKVMVLRELENRPYLEISELCTKDINIDMDKGQMDMPNPREFLDISLENKGDDYCFINFKYNENDELQMKIDPGKSFKFDKSEINNINSIQLDNKSKVVGLYRTYTNLSTIKSQISKGRSIIQNMTKNKFKYLDDNGIL